MKMCPECGFPVKFARYFDWRNDGTIIGTDRVRTQSQITFIESGELEGVFEELSLLLGVPLDHILIEAEKNVGKAFYASTPVRFLKYAPKNRYARPAFVARISVRVVRSEVAGLGAGLISTDSYRGGTSMVIRLENPCFIPRSVGNSLGIYESIEGIRGADYEYGIEDGDLVIWMRHSSVEKDPLSESRLYLEPIEPAEDIVRYDRCGTCGTPSLVAESLEWRLAEGLIINRITGKRELVQAVQSINAMMRELEAELGDEVLKPIYDCEKEITRAQLSTDMDIAAPGFRDDCLMYFAFRGLGYPRTLSEEGRSLRVEISNAYNAVLYAAKVAAVYECYTGLASDIQWLARESRSASFVLSPLDA